MRTVVRRHLTLLAGLCAALAVAAPSGAVIGGDADTAHPYVGLVASGGYVCSGSLVSPTVFVTAGHCILDPAVRVYFGGAVSPAAPSTTGTATVQPGFCLGCGIGLENDLAVVVLDAPVDMPFYAQLPVAGAADALPKKADVTLVGYGASFFVKKSPVSTFERLTVDVDLKKAKENLSATWLKLSAKKDGAACFGDSGGPNLLTGTDTILAINSFGTNDRCKKASYSYRLDTASARDFLDDFVAVP